MPEPGGLDLADTTERPPHGDAQLDPADLRHVGDVQRHRDPRLGRDIAGARNVADRVLEEGPRIGVGTEGDHRQRGSESETRHQVAHVALLSFSPANGRCRKLLEGYRGLTPRCKAAVEARLASGEHQVRLYREDDPVVVAAGAKRGGELLDQGTPGLVAEGADEGR